MRLNSTVEYNTPDVSSQEIHLVEVASIILHHQEGKFQMKEKKIVERFGSDVEEDWQTVRMTVLAGVND